jgi:hypothetical protein
MNKEFTLKDFTKEVDAKEKEGGKVVKYKIEYKNKDGKDKIKLDDKNKGTQKITAEKITKIIDGKESDVTNKEIEVSYVDGGWVTYHGEIKKVDGKDLESSCEVGFSGIGSFRPTFWIGLAVLILAIGGGI